MEDTRRVTVIDESPYPRTSE